MRRTCTSNLKQSGNHIFIVGETCEELGGSLLGQLLQWDGGDPPTMPAQPLMRYRAVHAAMQAGLVRSCHDLSEGGLAVALAEMCLGGRWGAAVDIGAAMGSDLSHPYVPLFSETNGRLLLEVTPADRATFEDILSDIPFALIGTVTDSQMLSVAIDRQPTFDLSLDEILSAWKGAETA